MWKSSCQLQVKICVQSFTVISLKIAYVEVELTYWMCKIIYQTYRTVVYAIYWLCTDNI